MIRRGVVLAGLISALMMPAPGPADEPRPGDDATFRPTVMIRNGSSLGTGTVIASSAGETLVLTAAHVVASETNPTRVALHRFNIGVEQTAKESAFPKQFAATVAARDPDADVAILRVPGLPALPYRARIEPGSNPPEPGIVVNSLGYDRGERLLGWTTRFRRTARLRIADERVDRMFYLTDDPPVEGRSGGGLYREDGTLIGVCVGRITWDTNKTLGLFSPIRNVHRLLAEHKDLAGSVARSQGELQAVAR
ncbi:S1 family peptidase [Tundrisphaera sp. TA3]|uniref:S1 family peptidase n=1 Tax=Tundrisphaera sp. TA3 TaxID=3435775 RepID=UPI003EBC5BA4